MSKVLRSVKNVVKNFTIPEVKVREATSNDPWFASTVELDELAQYTFQPKSQHEIFQILFKRLNDNSKYWRHKLKSLIVLEFLAFHGHPDMYKLLTTTSAIMHSLTTFMFVDKDGKEKGNFIRERAKKMIQYIENPNFFKSEQDKAKNLKKNVQRKILQTSDSYSMQPQSYTKPDYAPKNREEEDLQLQLAIAISKQEAEEIRTVIQTNDYESDHFDVFEQAKINNQNKIKSSDNIEKPMIDIFSNEFSQTSQNQQNFQQPNFQQQNYQQFNYQPPNYQQQSYQQQNFQQQNFQQQNFQQPNTYIQNQNNLFDVFKPQPSPNTQNFQNPSFFNLPNNYNQNNNQFPQTTNNQFPQISNIPFNTSTNEFNNQNNDFQNFLQSKSQFEQVQVQPQPQPQSQQNSFELINNQNSFELIHNQNSLDTLNQPKSEALNFVQNSGLVDLTMTGLCQNSNEKRVVEKKVSLNEMAGVGAGTGTGYQSNNLFQLPQHSSYSQSNTTNFQPSFNKVRNPFDDEDDKFA